MYKYLNSRYAKNENYANLKTWQESEYLHEIGD